MENCRQKYRICSCATEITKCYASRAVAKSNKQIKDELGILTVAQHRMSFKQIWAYLHFGQSYFGKMDSY